MLNKLTKLNDRTYLHRQWNWDYAEAHAFQREALAHVQENNIRILICCSHPRVLTNGRGLQKPRKGETLDLVEFDPTVAGKLPFPLHQIERGGGLTFHHPGQFIFYPIVKLNPQSLSLSKMTDEMFEYSIDVLSQWGIEGLTHSKKLLGLWHGERKLASMGIAIEKLTTFHGMALNIFRDEEMKRALRALNPCGLSGDIYTSAEELTALPENALDKFCDSYLERILHAWK
jgi:lipoyl(octanoyl) transferase